MIRLRRAPLQAYNLQEIGKWKVFRRANHIRSRSMSHGPARLQTQTMLRAAEETPVQTFTAAPMDHHQKVRSRSLSLSQYSSTNPTSFTFHVLYLCWCRLWSKLLFWPFEDCASKSRKYPSCCKKLRSWVLVKDQWQTLLLQAPWFDDPSELLNCDRLLFKAAQNSTFAIKK